MPHACSHNYYPHMWLLSFTLSWLKIDLALRAWTISGSRLIVQEGLARRVPGRVSTLRDAETYIGHLCFSTYSLAPHTRSVHHTLEHAAQAR